MLWNKGISEAEIDKKNSTMAKLVTHNQEG